MAVDWQDPFLAEYRKAFARTGGLARAKALTAAKRRAIAKQGAAARWKKTKKSRKAEAA